ncbi:MAG: hypothetical protein QNK37_22640 [Acidobacteriota bacterium]|nr:hypothetical protein [Acidobacteriota bacterium]
MRRYWKKGIWFVVPVSLCCAVLILAFKSESQDDPDRLAVHGYSESVPAAKAVADFNETARLDDIGKNRPPLTAREFLAAVRAWNSDDSDYEASIKKEILQIAETEKLPKGTVIRFTSGIIDRNGYDVDMWIIELQLGLNRYPADLADMPIFLVPIRTQFIASRPTTGP